MKSIAEEQFGCVDESSYACIESRTTWSDSNNDEESPDASDGKALNRSHKIDTDKRSSDSGEDNATTNTREIVLNDEDGPGKTSIPRAQSLDAISPESTEKSYMYSFRMPHDDPNNNNNIMNRQARSDGCASITDYNFVLDNYIEYADDTKIPRLRGMDDNNKILSAIHSSHWAVLCTVVTASCFMTYSLSNHAPFLRADLSQAIVITVVLATFPEVAASSGAGAFAGMSSLDAIPNYGWLALLALVVSVIWMIFYHFKILVGCGGRLGTCAFISMNIVALVSMLSRTVPWSLYGDASRLWSERLEVVPSILTVVASTFLSAVSGAVRLKSEIPLNPVQAPTTIALLCMLILEPTGFSYTEQIDAGLAVGSFVAMASASYLPSVLDFTGAGFTAGLWILLLDPFFIGFGGKKGFTSFCGFATYVAISRMIFRRTAEKDK